MRGLPLMGRLGPLTDGWKVFLWPELPAPVGRAPLSPSPFPVCEAEVGGFLLVALGDGAAGGVDPQHGCLCDGPHPGMWEGARRLQAPEPVITWSLTLVSLLSSPSFVGEHCFLLLRRLVRPEGGRSGLLAQGQAGLVPGRQKPLCAEGPVLMLCAPRAFLQVTREDGPSGDLGPLASCLGLSWPTCKVGHPFCPRCFQVWKGGDSPDGSAGKEPACHAEDLGSIPGFRKIRWRRERPPTPVFWPGESHGRYSPRGRRESDITEPSDCGREEDSGVSGVPAREARDLCVWTHS